MFAGPIFMLRRRWAGSFRTFGAMVFFGEIAHEEIADIEEEGNEQHRDESLPEEQHQQREHEGGHFDDGLVVSCDDESGFFDKTDEFHDQTSILNVFSNLCVCSSDVKRIPLEYEKILRDRLKQH